MKAIALSVAVVCALTVGLPHRLLQAAQDTIYEAGPGITLPRVIKEVKPHYPPGTIETGVQGNVLMKCVVGRDGRPRDVEVTKSLSPPLDEAAVEALKQWEFQPGAKDGEPVAVRVAIEMTFTLK